jgi:hypothetical protein
MGQYKQAQLEAGRECCNWCGDFHAPEDLRVESKNPYNGDSDLTCEPCFMEREKLKPNEVWVQAGPCWDDLEELA